MQAHLESQKSWRLGRHQRHPSLLPATTFQQRRSAACSAAQDAPDTAFRPSARRPGLGRRSGKRRPAKPESPPPLDRNAADNVFLNPEQFTVQDQLDAMQQAFSQMSDEERQAFVQYLGEQQAQAAGESFAALPPQEQQELLMAPFKNAMKLENTVLKGTWAAFLSSIPPADAALLLKVLPRGWYGASDLSRREIIEGMKRLTRAERRRLPALLDQVSELQTQIAITAAAEEQATRLAAARRRRLAAQKGITLREDERDSAAASVGSGAEALAAAWAGARGPARPAAGGGGETEEGKEEGAVEDISSFLDRVQERLRRQLQAGEDAGGREDGVSQAGGRDDGDADRRQQPGASTSGRGADGSANGSSGGGPVIPEVLQGRLGRMMTAYEAYVEGGGWDAEAAARESSEMRSLLRLHAEMSELATEAAAAASMGPGQRAGAASPAAVARALELQRRSDDLAEQVAALLEPGARERLQDPAARAVIRYMETQLLVPDPDGGMALDVDEEALSRLGRFMRAAVNWEGYRAFMTIYSSRHPELMLSSVMKAAGMSDGDEWWVAEPDSLHDDDNDDDNDDGDGDGDGGSANSAARDAGSGWEVPRVRVDWSRVDAISALDSDCLAFMSELEATGYSESTFMKWYFHPVLGPRIRAGSLLDPAKGGVAAAAATAAAGVGGGGGGEESLDPAALMMRLLGLRPGAVPELLQEAMRDATGGGAPEGSGGGVGGGGTGGGTGGAAGRRGVARGGAGARRGSP
ncbi:hypothetical protein GPECTOR_5g203 [Gonium pectorale]|uniref:Uncharacterized protein n=1 Tax=Gonium pectorale TaxID=33097 RepID=A0A150GXK3_GONPE|nr:hypothetical protein GPECTOR_5g203 [Gonium pectorale]|eukprot:KXZ54100.1 hypothetical protein GPECTOR_5g203 [Gonium pectorale]